MSENKARFICPKIQCLRTQHPKPVPPRFRLPKPGRLRFRPPTSTGYALLVLLCLIAIFFGTEFTSIKTQNDNFHKLITGQEIDVGGSSFKAGGGSSHAEVFNDILFSISRRWMV